MQARIVKTGHVRARAAGELARRTVTLPGSGRAKVIVRLQPQHLALLRRMGAIRVAARVDTAQSRSRTPLVVHAPAWAPAVFTDA